MQVCWLLCVDIDIECFPYYFSSLFFKTESLSILAEQAGQQDPGSVNLCLYLTQHWIAEAYDRTRLSTQMLEGHTQVLVCAQQMNFSLTFQTKSAFGLWGETKYKVGD